MDVAAVVAPDLDALADGIRSVRESPPATPERAAGAAATAPKTTAVRIVATSVKATTAPSTVTSATVGSSSGAMASNASTPALVEAPPDHVHDAHQGHPGPPQAPPLPGPGHLVGVEALPSSRTRATPASPSMRSTSRRRAARPSAEIR